MWAPTSEAQREGIREEEHRRQEPAPVEEETMSISADPMFVKAEVQWRRQSLAAGFPAPHGAHHHGSAVRSALAAVVHPHRHTRPAGQEQQGRPGAPRVA